MPGSSTQTFSLDSQMPMTAALVEFLKRQSSLILDWC